MYKQFQSSFSYCNFSDNNLPCLHPSETLKPPGERCGLLIIYLFDRPEQPTRGIFKRQLEHRGGWCYLSFLPRPPNLPCLLLSEDVNPEQSWQRSPCCPRGFFLAVCRQSLVSDYSLSGSPSHWSLFKPNRDVTSCQVMP